MFCTPFRRSLVFIAAFIGLTLLAVGCGGAGSSSPVGIPGGAGPEETVSRLIGSWKSGTARPLHLDVRSAVAGAGNSALVTTSVASGPSLTYTDLSGTAWPFQIASVTYPTVDRAQVYTYFVPVLTGATAASTPVRIELDLFLQRANSGLWEIYDLTVRIPVYLPPFQAPTATATDTASGLRPLNGTVRDGVTGNLLSGALVQLDGPTLTSPMKTTTDANGYFDFGNVAIGNYTLVVEAGGFVIYTQNLTLN